MKQMRIDWKKTGWMTIIIVGWFLIGWIARGVFIGPDLVLFSQAQENLVNKAYGSPPTRREFTYTAIRAMLTRLEDKYAEFQDPTLYARYKEQLSGEGSAMIGIQGEMHKGQFVITFVIPQNPADLAGLKTGDIITEVDGWAVTPTATANEVLQMLRNNKKPVAQLRVLRDEKLLSIDVTRKAVAEVQTRMLDNQLLYVRFDVEGTKTPAALKSALQDGLKANPKGLVLDLRYNGGGWMDSAQGILDLFLGDGMAFYAKPKTGVLHPYPTHAGDLAETIPLVVLTGPHTYSAGETIAAAIQDRGRGKVIGETTYGKGSIKETVALADGSAIDFTVARWLSPVSQQNYEGRGVTPDITIPSSTADGPDVVLEGAVGYLARLLK